MAFPAIVQSNVGVTDPASTSHTVSLGGTATIGNLLLVVFYPRNFVWQPAPAGYTTLVADSGTNLPIVYVKVADGTETGVSFSTASTLASWCMFEISGWSGYLPSVAGTVPFDKAGIVLSHSTATSTTPNPPNLNPAVHGWADTDTLWLAVFAANQGDRTVSATPASYTDLGYVGAGTAAGVAIGAAWRQLNASSEDPGAWTISASTAWNAWTIGIRSADSLVPNVRTTQLATEVGYSGVPGLRTSQFATEVGYVGAPAINLSQYVLEVAYIQAPDNQNRRMWVGSWI